MQEYQLYIDGQFGPAASGKTVDSINPATEAPWARVAHAGREDTQHAIKVARQAFDEGPWPRMTQADRAKILNHIADGLQARAHEIAVVETHDSGGTIRKTGGDLLLANAQLRYFAEMAEQLPLLTEIQVPQFPAQSKNFLQREPFGVCGQIIPWNFPLMMAVSKIGPALATGNTIVLKPASDTPCSAFELAQVIDQTDLPKGVMRDLLHGVGGELHDAPADGGRAGECDLVDQRTGAQLFAALRAGAVNDVAEKTGFSRGRFCESRLRPAYLLGCGRRAEMAAGRFRRTMSWPVGRHRVIPSS